MDIIRFIFWHVHRTTEWGDLTGVDYALIGFNALEALAWFGCAACVFRRNHLNPETPSAAPTSLEDLYAVLFLLFGMTDVVEVFQVSSQLIWIKLAIVVPLFLVRYRVRKNRPQAQWV